MKTLFPILMLSAMCAVQAAELEAEAEPMLPAAASAAEAAPVPVPDTAGIAAVPPDSVSAEVHKAAAAGDGDAVRRLLYDTPPDENDRSRFAFEAGAVRKPSAAGPVLAVTGFALAAVGAIVASGTEHTVQKSRTVDPCWGRIDFWNPCDEPKRTEYYTETETDWGRKILGSAGIAAGLGMGIGGLITIVARHPPKPMPRSGSAGSSGKTIAVAWTRTF